MRKPNHRLIRNAALVAMAWFLSIMGSYREDASPAVGSDSTSLTLTTKAFQANGPIPQPYSCEGPDISPELDWSNAPAKTRSFALILEDPDAPGGTWVHWVVYDLPAGAHHLQAGIPRRDDIEGGGRQGDNDFGRVGYNGPCPPPGPPHRYFFRLYSLDTVLNLRGRVQKIAAEQGMKGHVLAQTELMGTYQRK